MSIDTTNEKRFESDIEAAFLSPAGGYVKGTDTYDPNLGLYVDTLVTFIQKTQPKEWARFENANKVDTVRKFCVAFNNACDMSGLVSVLSAVAVIVPSPLSTIASEPAMISSAIHCSVHQPLQIRIWYESKPSAGTNLMWKGPPMSFSQTS